MNPTTEEQAQVAQLVEELRGLCTPGAAILDEVLTLLRENDLAGALNRLIAASDDDLASTALAGAFRLLKSEEVVVEVTGDVGRFLTSQRP